MPTLQGDVRRRSARVSVPIALRVRPVDFSDGSFEDVASTVNVSRGAMYVSTWRENYYAGMRLIITYPYIAKSTASAMPSFSAKRRTARAYGEQLGRPTR